MTIQRTQRLRASEPLRRLVRETLLDPSQLIVPIFIRHGHDDVRPIKSMPGYFQITLDHLPNEIKTIQSLGLHAVMPFSLPAHKDAHGSANLQDNEIIPTAIRMIKDIAPEMVVVPDLCMCDYTDHGHCGFVDDKTGALLNDKTLAYLQKAATLYATAGADMLAPSGMIDGAVGAVRHALDENGHQLVSILSHTSKFASGFYGPFRDALESAPRFGDRRGYQMDPANRREARKKAQIDIAEGADILMVKPALPYLDVVADFRAAFSLPIAAYHVSGEYAMLIAASQNGWIDLRRCVLESLTSIRRAGADVIVTYFAKDAAKWLS